MRQCDRQDRVEQSIDARDEMRYDENATSPSLIDIHQLLNASGHRDGRLRCWAPYSVHQVVSVQIQMRFER